MALVSLNYYQNIYKGELTADFPKLEARAEDLVLSLIHNADFDKLSVEDQTAVMKAICAQVEYFNEYGAGVAVYGREAGGGFTVGKVSVNNGSGAGALTGAKSMIAPVVYVYLEQTGLLNNQVPTAGMPSQAWGWF